MTPLTEGLVLAHRFDGSVVLITGAAGGIGAATARAFGAAGARLALVDANQAALDEVVADLIAAGLPAERVISFVADVASEAAVRDYVQATVERHGSLDVLFNNAGIEGGVVPCQEYVTEEFDRVLRVNVRGVWLNMRYAILAMKEAGRGGSIINTGSAVSLAGAPDIAPYVASKHAVLGMTRSVAIEVAESGIRINAVCPGPTDTRMQRTIEESMSGGYEAGHAAVMRLIPMRRHSTVDEIAAVVLFLASADSSSMTGSAVSVDGGITAGL